MPPPPPDTPEEKEAARQARRKLLYVPKHTRAVPFKPRKTKTARRATVRSEDYWLMGHRNAAKGLSLTESIEALQRHRSFPDEAARLLEDGWWDYHAHRLFASRLTPSPQEKPACQTPQKNPAL
jgi:hypothetical protein